MDTEIYYLHLGNLISMLAQGNHDTMNTHTVRLTGESYIYTIYHQSDIIHIDSPNILSVKKQATYNFYREK